MRSTQAANVTASSVDRRVGWNKLAHDLVGLAYRSMPNNRWDSDSASAKHLRMLPPVISWSSSPIPSRLSRDLVGTRTERQGQRRPLRLLFAGSNLPA